MINENIILSIFFLILINALGRSSIALKSPLLIETLFSCAPQLFCQNMHSGNLVSVVNQAEGDFVASLVKESGTSDSKVWIGLYDPNKVSLAGVCSPGQYYSGSIGLAIRHALLLGTSMCLDSVMPRVIMQDCV